jgi:hypothetical protein
VITHINETAFLGLVLSSIEAFKKECYGLLLGYRTDDKIVVEFAIPYQTAERGHTMVVPNWWRDQRVRACLQFLSHLELLGTFHSHASWGNLRANPRLSDWDAQTMDEGNVEIIVAVNDLLRRSAWRNIDGGRQLAGSLSDFSLSLAAYYRNGNHRRPVRTQIRCPYALGFQAHEPKNGSMGQWTH